MELESSYLIDLKKPKKDKSFDIFSYKKDLFLFKNYLHSIFGFINISIILFVLLIFISNRINYLINSFNFTFYRVNKKNLKYYQDIQHSFCDNIRFLYNKELEEKMTLLNVSLNDSNYDLFIYDNNNVLSYDIKSNQSFEREGILHMLKAIKIYTNKHNYINSDIVLIDIGANMGFFSIFFAKLNYSIVSFEPLPENYYILKKNFCRNNKNFFGPSPSVLIIDELLSPKETFCDYFKDLENSKKNIILCDKSKEKNLEKDYIKIGRIKTIKLINFIPLLNEKKVILMRLDLEYEGLMAIESAKELISNYHIPFIFIKFNSIILKIYQKRPEDFFGFFIGNGYKMSLSGFITNKFIGIDDLVKNNLETINLYFIYDWKQNNH